MIFRVFFLRLKRLAQLGTIGTLMQRRGFKKAIVLLIATEEAILIAVLPVTIIPPLLFQRSGIHQKQTRFSVDWMKIPVD
jgi:hypothetical protein